MTGSHLFAFKLYNPKVIFKGRIVFGFFNLEVTLKMFCLLNCRTHENTTPTRRRPPHTQIIQNTETVFQKSFWNSEERFS